MNELVVLIHIKKAAVPILLRVYANLLVGTAAILEFGLYSSYLPRTPDDGDIPVSAGAAVITPQRRFACVAQVIRAPQGSPQVFRRP